jgi:hypothetical protein
VGVILVVQLLERSLLPLFLLAKDLDGVLELRGYCSVEHTYTWYMTEMTRQADGEST